MRSRRGASLLAVLVTALLAPFAVVSSSWGASGTTYTKAISRVHLVDGKDVVADSRTFRVTVGSTTSLRDRQGVRVSWSGAHPTNHVVPDPNTGLAGRQEYPVVLLQCRGVDSTAVPAAQRLRPETCWTQTPSERHLLSPGVPWSPWRVDRYAPVADRTAAAGRPNPVPSGCYDTGYTERWLHFVSVTGRDFPGGLGGCAGMAPESAGVDSNQSQPPNTTYAATGPDGRGSARFVVWTAQTNASLGCSETVACSLVVIPIEGISCDVASAGLPVDERPTGDDATQAAEKCQTDGGPSFAEPAVMGSLWWSASNWRNRVSVPLQFTPLPGDCGLSSDTSGVQVYGSELLVQATQSWGATFCRSRSLFPFRHVQVGEPQARNLLSTGLVSAAFTSSPPGPQVAVPHVLAPAAVTGFAVGYSIDDADRHEYHQLRLTPRLLAKLLTMSYPAISAVKDNDPPLSHNPLDMSLDPEFQALNPSIPKGVNAGQSASTLFSLSSDSDVVQALTAYITADPEARAWLDGSADPWGMVVNPAYKGIALPVNSWPLLDTFEPRSIYTEANLCLQHDPVPYLPLVAAPASRLVSISLGLQFAIAPSQLVCQFPADGSIAGAKLVALGRQQIGNRFLVGITSLADARRYDIDTAALQTRVSASAPPAMRDATGRTFVAPSDASLRAAAALLRPDTAAGSWALDDAALVGASGSTTAYPGTMLVSTLVATQGLDPALAGRYATLLRYIAGPGQVPGQQLGKLPSGYLPLTAANGLGALASYALRAADAVAAQSGSVPSLLPPPAAVVPTSPPPVTAPSSGTVVPRAAVVAAPALSGGAVLARGPLVAGPAPRLAGQTAGVPTAGAFVGAAAVLLPLLVGVALAAGAGYGCLTLTGRRGSS